MRRRLIPPAMGTAVATAAVLTGLAGPAAAQDPPSPAPVVVAGHATSAGTALVAGQNRPGTRLHVEPARTTAVRTLEIDYQVQETGYWCGPAATRIALSARVAPPSQATLAADRKSVV